MSLIKEFSKGFFRENPLLVLLIGMCPSLATTTSAINGLGMGIATTFVLTSSNITVALLTKFIPDKVRIPSFIVIIASFVTIVDLTMQAFVPGLYETLGIFIPLIVVNCIVLARAEAFASRNKVWPAFLDGSGMGLGFTMALGILGAIREILGEGSIFGIDLIKGDGMLVFILAPGAFIALGYLIAFINKIKKLLEVK